MIIKSSYKDSVNKRTIQKIVYGKIRSKYTNLIGLGGPDLPDYLKLAKKAKIKSALIYENNVDHLLVQASKKNDTIPTRVVYGNILQAPSEKDTFYDLDFCCSVISVISHIQKFKDNPCMFTFSVRPVGFDETVNKFINTLYGENYNISLEEERIEYKKYLIVTPNKSVTVYRYTDTSPMAVFLNNI